VLSSVLRAIAVLACLSCTSCIESDFRLASDSRLPRWFSLPANLKRSDVTVRITYYTSGSRIQLIGPSGAVIASVTGTDRLSPETERHPGRYPSYSLIKVANIEEILEQRSPGDILYVAERVAASEEERLAVLRQELQAKLAKKGTSEAADFKELTELALQAKEYQIASSIATERLSAVRTRGCQCDDDAHRANIVLGLVAIRQGNVPDAKSYLLAAGRVGPSPALSSFGPNMQLAKELLKRGERETVSTYFDECGTFWSSGRKRLTEWKQQVARGEVPDFGSNVVY
jgi:hypothetical protein